MMNKIDKYCKVSVEAELASNVLTSVTQLPVTLQLDSLVISYIQLYGMFSEFWRVVIVMFGHLYIMEHVLTRNFPGFIK